MLHDLFVYDKSKKLIHKIGDKPYDSIWVSDEGIRYQNLETGEYGDFEGSIYNRYAIIHTNAGRLVDEFGEAIDKRFAPAVLGYLKYLV